nr:MAG TPA: hypothetical protein [Caudoviricetes sp.]
MEVKIVRLVDLDAVIDCLEVEWGYEGIREDLYSLPVVDAVPVVRCRDCEYARDLGFQFGGLVHESWFCIYNGPHTTGANDFCSHGQKREEGEIEDDP